MIYIPSVTSLGGMNLRPTLYGSGSRLSIVSRRNTAAPGKPGVNIVMSSNFSRSN